MNQNNTIIEKGLTRDQYKNKSRLITEREIRNGSIIRKSCEVCGKEKTDAHHPDYSKPLEIKWLCRKHHKQWHRDNEIVMSEYKDRLVKIIRLTPETHRKLKMISSLLLTKKSKVIEDLINRAYGKIMEV